MSEIQDAFLKGFIKAANNNPYNDKGCPICGEHAIGSCRCMGPHSMADLQKGHGLRCPNGHHFSGDLSYNPGTKND